MPGRSAAKSKPLFRSVHFAPLLLAALLVAIYSLGEGVASWLHYDRAQILSGQLWRAISCHFVHANLVHLCLNITGIIMTWFLWHAWFSPRYFVYGILFCAAGTGAGLLLFNPELDYYHGFSGVLHGLFAIGALAAARDRDWLGYLFGFLLVIKLLTEYLSGTAIIGTEFLRGPVITDAHLWGALTGLVVGSFMSFRRRAVI